jgi:AGCS family alanine or glycine:cation symporter
VMYVVAAVTVLAFAADRIVPSLQLILRQAFTPTAAGGGFLGATVALTLQWGVKRALFSNEAGQGSAPIAHAAAKTKEPVREGLVAMIGPLVDTIIICSMTGLVIVMTDAWRTGLDVDGALLNGGPLTSWAFQEGLRPLGAWGAYVVTVAIPFYGFSTSVSWSYYGDRCVDYLWGPDARRVYRWVFVLFQFLGAVWSLRLVWAFADICNGLMAVPNMIGVVGLSGVVVRLTKDYFSRPQIPAH